jgi:hypothetical protein
LPKSPELPKLPKLKGWWSEPQGETKNYGNYGNSCDFGNHHLVLANYDFRRTFGWSLA